MFTTEWFEGWQLTDAQLADALVGAFRDKARAEATCARLTAIAIERDLPRSLGYSSAGALIAHTTKVSTHEASKTVRRARGLGPDAEATHAVWAAGDLSSEQAEIIAKTVTELPEWAAAEIPIAEEHLLEFAKKFDLKDLRRLANHIIEVIDPDGAEEHIGRQLEEEERKAFAQTYFQMFNAGDGMTKGRFLIPNAQASILGTVLEGISSPRRMNRNVSGIDEDGEHSDAAVGRLPYPQRLGQAFLELLEHLPSTAMPQNGGLAASITINIDQEKLYNLIGTATLSTGIEMSAGQARRFACNAQLIPMVLDGDSKILDLGTSKRLYDRYQRIALAKRDQGCCWKGCNRPPSWCEAHHLTWVSRGGPTDLDNGALFCFFHHHLLHNDEWDARMGSDGVVEVIPPRRIDPQQRPIRHSRFKRRQPLPA